MTAKETIIEPARGWSALQLAEIWDYRNLLFMFFQRDVQGRYRQMALGPLWIIFQPLFNMVILSFVFGNLADLPSEGVPYPIFIYVALLPWQFFANSTRGAAQSLLQQRAIIAKVYFPRLIIPLAAVMAAFVDFLASFIVLLGLILFYQVDLTWNMLWLPAFLLLSAIAGLAVGLWLAGLAVKYRDVSIGLGFMLTGWQYLTPVAYSATLIPDKWQWLYRLNPVYHVVEGFRWAVLSLNDGPHFSLVYVLAGLLPLLIGGMYYFRRSERAVVDVI